MKLEEFFQKRPVFSIEELAGFLAEEGPRRPRTRDSLLAYHKSVGRIVRMRRGLFAVVPAGADPRTHPIDPFLLAGKMTKDAVLAYHTALEFHGKAHSHQECFTYLSERTPRPMAFQGRVFRGIQVPRVLLRKSKEDFGVVRSDRQGVEIRVTSLERTFVDVLNRPDLSGSWEEIWCSLESVELFELEQVVEYCLILENATTAAKVGFFLEQHRESLSVGNAHLAALQKLRPRQPHYLERRLRMSGRLLADWNLVVPAALIERSWEEAS